jgi:L-rhamnose isomerase
MERAATGVAADGGTAAGGITGIVIAAGQSPGQLETADQEKAALEERFPGWRVWYVHRVVGHTVWCARRGPVLLNEDSPEHLAEAIEQADAEAATP